MLRKKIGFLLGLGAGYVLGARAGRQRYEQIAAKARKVVNDPRVQAKASQAQHLAQEKAGQAGSAVTDKVKEKAGEAGSAVTDKVKEKVQERKDDSSGSGAGTDAGTPSSSDSGSADPTATTPVSSPADAGDSSRSGDPAATPNDMPESGPPANSPSAKLPPHPVAQPGTPGGSLS